MDTERATAMRPKALVLLSGGLDSRLAVCLLREQGVTVEGVVFASPFFALELARRGAAELNLTLHVLDFTADILSLLRRPKHGFGSCLNPCVDCHALMLRRAGERMAATGSDFLCTGEVLDERPKSQNRVSLGIVAKESGYADLILRPLSAGLLPPTRPETEGWVDRSRLLSLRGRCRRPQLELAKRYQLREIPTPAGGCLLTDPGFCARLRELMDNEGVDDVRDVHLLKVGRHFRLAPGVKLVVGRQHAENERIASLVRPGDRLLDAAEAPGPTALLPAAAGDDLLSRAAAICATYSDLPGSGEATIRVRGGDGDKLLRVAPLSREAAREWMV